MKALLSGVEKALIDSNWYAALILALTLPDIAGWVDDPKAGSQKRYAAWVEQNLVQKYTADLPSGTTKFLSGDDCYALRCALLHEGRDETASQRAAKSGVGIQQFQFTAPPSNFGHCNHLSGVLQLQVDIFCRDVCASVQVWLANRASIGDADWRARLENGATIKTGGSLTFAGGAIVFTG